MLNTIQEKLAELERANDVQILYACESGSRAWGFASPDSDYDVRFIYTHGRNHYLSIGNKRDVIELPVNEVLDIGGWDIRKALWLYKKTNAALFEWLQSPIVYKRNEAFHGALLQMKDQFYSPRAGFHHYISMAVNCFENDLQKDEVRLKKYFYVLRPVLAAKWIVDKQSVPPMEFFQLRALIEDRSLQNELDLLLTEKKNADEKTLVRPSATLHNFIADTISYCNAKKDLLQETEPDTEPLNKLFRSTIGIHES